MSYFIYIYIKSVTVAVKSKCHTSVPRTEPESEPESRLAFIGSCYRPCSGRRCGAMSARLCGCSTDRSMQRHDTGTHRPEG